MFPDRGRYRHRMRLSTYDYAGAGVYFVTMCTEKRMPILSRIVAGGVHLRPGGHIVRQAWQWVCRLHPWVHVTDGVIMPDHIHVILMIDDAPRRAKHLGRIIGAVKSHSTRVMQARVASGTARVWQRGYYERVIRNQRHYAACQRYIVANPLRWGIVHDGPSEIMVDHSDDEVGLDTGDTGDQRIISTTVSSRR